MFETTFTRMERLGPTPARAWTSALQGSAVLLAALALCWLAVWNGQPFLHPDSPSYVRGAETALTTLFGDAFATEWTQPAPAGGQTGPADAEVGGGRSIFYALLAWTGALAGFWPVVLIQAVALAWLLRTVLRASGAGGFGVYATAVGVTAFLTPAPFFVAFVMPDLWAGLAIGAVAALFAFPGRLSRAERLTLGAMLLFAALAHNSVVLILVLLASLGGLLALLRRRTAPDPRPALAFSALAVGAAVAATMAFNAAVERTTGQPPVMPPFLTARVIEDGPGLRYVREHCGEAEWEVCRYADRLPLKVDYFLWLEDPAQGVFNVASPDSRRALSREQTRFTLAVFAAYPAEQIAATLRNAAGQTVRTDLEDFAYLPPFMAQMGERVAEPHLGRFQQVRAVGGGLPLTALERIHALAAVAALIGAAVLFVRGRSGGVRPAAALFFALIVAGLLANAAVCGALSALHGRYQARALWLLPFASIVLAAAAHTARAAVRPVKGARP